MTEATLPEGGGGVSRATTEWARAGVSSIRRVGPHLMRKDASQPEPVGSAADGLLDAVQKTVGDSLFVGDDDDEDADDGEVAGEEVGSSDSAGEATPTRPPICVSQGFQEAVRWPQKMIEYIRTTIEGDRLPCADCCPLLAEVLETFEKTLRPPLDRLLETAAHSHLPPPPTAIALLRDAGQSPGKGGPARKRLIQGGGTKRIGRRRRQIASSSDGKEESPIRPSPIEISDSDNI